MLPSLTAAHSHANGLALPQSPMPIRSQLSGSLRGATTCFSVDHSGKNAPLMTDQSPSSHARTSSGSRSASTAQRIGRRDTRCRSRGRDIHALQPGLGVGNDLEPTRRRVDVAGLHPLVARTAGLPVSRIRHGTPAPERSVACSFLIGDGDGNCPLPPRRRACSCAPGSCPRRCHAPDSRTAGARRSASRSASAGSAPGQESAQRLIQHLRALERLGQLDAGPAHHDPDGIARVAIGMRSPIPSTPSVFPPPARRRRTPRRPDTTAARFVGRAANARRLPGFVLLRPFLNPGRLGGRDHHEALADLSPCLVTSSLSPNTLGRILLSSHLRVSARRRERWTCS